jgi:hypothetical protein
MRGARATEAEVDPMIRRLFSIVITLSILLERQSDGHRTDSFGGGLNRRT